MTMPVQPLIRTENADNRRYAPRYTVRVPASGSDGIAAFKVCIQSISTTGFSIEAPVELKVGSPIEIDLPGAGPTPARVMWSNGMTSGCVVEEPLDKSVVSATRLKGEPVAAEAPPVESSPPEIVLETQPQRWPGAVRVVFVLGAGAAAWALVLAAITALN